MICVADLIGRHEVPANYGRGMVVTHWMPLPDPPGGGTKKPPL